MSAATGGKAESRKRSGRSGSPVIPFILLIVAFTACSDLPTAAPSSPAVPGSRSDLVGGTVTYLTQQLLLLESRLPDGSLIVDDPPPFGNTIHEVTHDNQDSWKIHVSSGTVTFEQDNCNSAATPLPTGALHLVVVPGAGPLTYARLRSTRYHRTYLRDLTRLDYYACEQRNNGQQWPFIVLEIDWDGNNTIDDEIIFEPAYQSDDGGVCGLTESQQQEPAYNVWQYWDALRKDPSADTYRACWWSTDDPAFSPGVTIRTLSEYIAAHPNAAIVNRDGNHGGVQIMHGFASASDNFDGWVDAFTIGKDMNNANSQRENSTVTYDFEQE